MLRPAGSKRLRVAHPQTEQVAAGISRALVADLSEMLEKDGLPPDAAVEQAVRFFRLLGGACGNRALEMAAEPLTRLLRPTLRRMIDKLPQAQGRIGEAQQALLEAMLEAMRRRNAGAARDWMTRHIRDFRRGHEVAGISLEAHIEAQIDD